ncbi:MAG: PH domain-containing protein [Coriobacteriaceae bacterium]|nr:PH domain-containing protein [Coriobacteriaceae bacterium]
MNPGSHGVHHSYVWLGGLKLSVVMIFSIGVSVIGSAGGMLFAALSSPDPGTPLWMVPLIIGGGLAGCLLIVGIDFLIYWLAWKNLRYELGPQEFSLYSGVFSKKRMHVPYQRIQSVDTRASLLQRLVGVCTLEVDTAGGSSNAAILVPYLLKSDAQALRHELFARKAVVLAGGSITQDGSYLAADGTPLVLDGPASQPSAAAAGVNVLDELTSPLQGAAGIFDAASFAESQPASYEASLTNKELLLAGISDMRSVLGAIILGLVGFGAAVLSLDFFSDALIDYVEQQVEGGIFAQLLSGALGPSLFLRMLLPLAVAFMGSMIVVSALSAIGSVLSYGGFKVRRRGSRIEVERGLLQRRTQGVDIDRVQLLRVQHGWIRRKLGYCKVLVGRIDSVAGEDNSNGSASAMASEGMVVHPFLRTSDLPAFLEGLMPELTCSCDVSMRPAPRARGRAVRRHGLVYNWGFWCLVACLLCTAGALMAVALASPRYLGTAVRMAVTASPLVLVLLAVMSVGMVRGAKWHAGSRLEYGGGFIHLVNEGFSCEEVVAPRCKVQYSTVRENPFQNRVGLATACFTTAAGVGGHTEKIWDLDLQDAEAFQEHLRPRR